MTVKPTKEQQAKNLWLTELQLRQCMILDAKLNSGGPRLPDTWSYGKHSVTKKDIELSSDGAGLAAQLLEKTMTHMLCVVAVQAIKDAVVPQALNSEQEVVKRVRTEFREEAPKLAAFEIVRLIRNAFAHQPYEPRWLITGAAADRLYSVDRIELDTTGKNGTRVEWQHYGGLLAIWHLSQWIRVHILDDKVNKSALVAKDAK